MKHFKTSSDLSRANGFTPPEHPLIGLHRCNVCMSLSNKEFTTDFYMISFKTIKWASSCYGRTKYDHENGSMIFVKPHRVIEFKNLEFEEDGFLIFVHEDYLNGLCSSR